ncbi:Rio2, N-terminal-domain-containing protein [Lasiosphaeria miniovina]|uniref:Serine/threonine-protein kinase RIO2 n=1 Tax=Lasiosphaeria miniovina TaxID=1954250 RepID=A0AA40E4J0_9PEZI|nr:Rio2, N-terminal-domain-containing protein [Lasiosphaeria miniovina]KAK0722268.1 Rio2, N-terminal-domain-containing protein [Lasiosphaeria miniovina]
MLLDTRAMRHLTAEDWKVLTATEMGTKNHELVPTQLIERLSRLKGGASGVHKSISALAKAGLIARMKEAKYDGYRLTYGGLDYLALHTHSQRRQVYSVGTRIGVGKESDIMIVADDTGTQKVLKIHRLGRISFRTVKSNRDYLKKNQACGSWMYLSRLAAMKEYAFMQALRQEGFPVPEPLSQSRHTIVMTLINAHPLRQISSVPNPAGLYGELIGLILRFAKHGLIHGDFNEFNILIKEERPVPETESKGKGKDGDDEEEPPRILTPIVIDFPQMVSMEHQNAEMYFDRDVHCIKYFFERRFHFVATEPGPFFKDAKKTVGKGGARRLDATAEASGFTKKMAKDLETAIRNQAVIQESAPDSSDEDEEDEDEDQEEENDNEDTKVHFSDTLPESGEGMVKLVISEST